MALNVYVQITAQGTLLHGDVSVATMGGTDVSAGHIEAHALYHEVSVNVSGSTDTQRTRETQSFGPIIFTKRNDRATPQLFRAWSQNHSIDAVFKLFDTNPVDGTTRFWQVIHVWNARISAIRTEMLNNVTPEGAPMPVLERVTVAYNDILVRNMVNSTEWSRT